MASEILKTYLNIRIGTGMNDYKFHYIDNEYIIFSYNLNNNPNKRGCCCILINEYKIYYSYLDESKSISEVIGLGMHGDSSFSNKNRRIEINNLFNKYINEYNN
jgi:hypothetical protein